MIAVSLTYTISVAVLRGMTSASLPFRRTEKAHPEAPGPVAWRSVIRAIRFDMALAIALLVAGLTLLLRYGLGNHDALTWCLVLWLQAVPGLAAIALSLASARWSTR